MSHKRNIQTFYFNSIFATKQGKEFRQSFHIDKRVNHIEVVQYSIPKSYYIINYNNNTIGYDYKDPANFQEIIDDFTLEVGNYTRSQLEAALVSQLNSLGYGLVFTATHRNDLENGKITITCTSGLTGQKSFQLLFSSENSPWQILNADTEIGGTQYIFNTTINSYDFGPINLQEANNIYLCSNQIKASNNISKQGQQLNNVLYTFSMQNIQQFNFATMQYHFDDHKRMNRDYESEMLELRLYFIDDNLSEVDFQNIPFALSVQMFYIEHEEAQLAELHTIDKRISVLTEFLMRRFATENDKLFMQQVIKQESRITQQELLEKQRAQTLFRK